MDKKTEQVKEHILELVNKNRIYHAILLTGDNCVTFGLARLLAKSLVCKSTDLRPCNNCSSCKKADNDNHPDISVLSAAPGRSSLQVDDVRFLSEDSYIVPNESSCKAYILKNAEDMTISAGNALLKLVEEPPNGVIFIITCESSTSLLPTVVSRCAIFPLGHSDRKQENEVASKMANEFLRALIAGHRAFFLKTAILFKEKDRQLIVDTIDRMCLVLDKAICIKSKNKMYPSDIEDEIAQIFTYRTLYELQNSFLSFKNKFAMNANKNILLTQFCIEVKNALGITKNI